MASHRYGPVEGSPALVEALARKLRDENGLDLDGSRILVTAGSNMAFLSVVQAITSPGRRDHPAVAVLLQSRDGRADRRLRAGARADRRASTRSIPTRSRARSRRARAPSSPCRPTTRPAPSTRRRRCAPSTSCARGAGCCTSRTKRTSTSPGTRPRTSRRARCRGAGAHTISLYSLSKAYGFAGWRVGYMVIPEALNEAVYKVQDTVLICPPLVSQAAALACVQVGRAWTAALPRPARAPSGARCCDCSRRSPTSATCRRPAARSTACRACGRRSTAMTVMERLVREHKVAAIAGETFGLTGRLLPARVVRGARGGDGERRDAAPGDGAARHLRALPRCRPKPVVAGPTLSGRSARRS